MEFLDCGLNGAFRLRIERTCRLIEDEELRFPREYARERYALALPARKKNPAVADVRIVPFGKPFYKPVHIGLLCGLNHIFTRESGVVERNIRENRVIQ